MTGAMVDFTEQREMRDRLSAMVTELQHRTRNLIGVVRAMADRTMRSSADLQEFDAKFRSRLDAMARVQGLLSRLGSGDRIAFDELIETEIAALDGEDAAGKIRLEGPRGIRLRSSTVQTLALALHELGANALKHGALAQEGARLEVVWSFEKDGEGGRPWLHIDWRESGVAMPQAPGPGPRSGDGRELIEHALPYQLGARTNFSLKADGAHCTLALPVSHRGHEAV
jgi:two-component sensor histidine kinase